MTVFLWHEILPGQSIYHQLTFSKQYSLLDKSSIIFCVFIALALQKCRSSMQHFSGPYQVNWKSGLSLWRFTGSQCFHGQLLFSYYLTTSSDPFSDMCLFSGIMINRTYWLLLTYLVWLPSQVANLNENISIPAGYNLNLMVSCSPRHTCSSPTARFIISAPEKLWCSKLTILVQIDLSFLLFEVLCSCKLWTAREVRVIVTSLCCHTGVWSSSGCTCGLYWCYC